MLGLEMIPERSFADQHAVHNQAGSAPELQFERIALSNNPVLAQQLVDVRA
ncbi:hypothetical protein [Pseudomonas sp.]|uniref:hypothetical protein n=1 Tax=Pseudomonas sp. TaxID=306 RepID=UPI00273149FD|nr:hypothetical protein [Pseudomonas sp.]MDP2244294.1 hypothetical protein [Pseudomonas sp.]